MKKKILILSILALLFTAVLILGGCGSKKSGSRSDVKKPEQTPEQTVEILEPTVTKPAPTVIIVPPAETPTPTPTPSPTPTPKPTPSPTPKPHIPIITKSPTSETVIEGGSCSFVAGYQNAIWAVWHFVSPDGSTDITYDKAIKVFPYATIKDGMYSTMYLSNVTYNMNGWKVYCR